MKGRRLASCLVEHAAVLLLYAALFVGLTWPSVLRMHTHVLADSGDGLQMYWNVWWVRHAATTEGLKVFETPLLFYPQTPNLFVHSLHPFGGFLTIPFAPFLGDVASFNLVVVFAFAVSGWGAYLLSKELTGRVAAAFVGGYVFTFSNFHFAHAQGHLNLVLMQWIPFYLLFLLRLVTRDRRRDALLAASFLFLVLLCDHYYFLFCVIASLVVFGWGLWFWRTRILTPTALKRFGLFTVLALGTSGAYVWHVLDAASAGRIGGNKARTYGMDLLALIIPGGHWRFHSLTEPYWQRLSGNIHESSVHLGLGAIGLAVCGYLFLRGRDSNVRFLLAALVLVFAGLSLGKDLQVFGRHVPLLMPYDLLERLLPLVRIGGVPVRFIVICILAVSALAACGARFLSSSRRRRFALMLLLFAVFVELLPRPVPSTPVEFPSHVEFLARRAAAQPGAVLDLAHAPQMAMVHQTRHGQPIHTGQLARRQHVVRRSHSEIVNLVERGEFAELRSRYGFRYVISYEPQPGCRVIYDGEIQVCEIVPGAGAASSSNTAR